MSADNGIHIIQTGKNKYDVRYYFASHDYENDEDMTLISTETTLEAAIVVGQSENTEYGLSFSLTDQENT